MKSQLITNYEEFINSFNLIKNKPFLFSLTLIIDFIFVFLFLMVTRKVVDLIELYIGHVKAYEHLQTEISISLNQIISTSLIYILIVFILFFIFQSVNWYISNKILNNNTKFFILNFSLISLFYFVLITIALYFPLKIATNSLFENQFFLEKITPFLIIIILIFLLINLCTLDFKKTYNKFHFFILPLIIVFAIVVGIDYFSRLLILLGVKNIFYLIITGIILFKGIAFSRIYLIKIGKK